MDHAYPFGGIEFTALTIWQRIIPLLMCSHGQTAEGQDIQHQAGFHGVSECVLNRRAQGKRKEEILVHNGREGIESSKKRIRETLDQSQWKRLQPALAGRRRERTDVHGQRRSFHLQVNHVVLTQVFMSFQQSLGKDLARPRPQDDAMLTEGDGYMALARSVCAGRIPVEFKVIRRAHIWRVGLGSDHWLVGCAATAAAAAVMRW